jgi:diacylglycerol kinase (ATP)
MAVPLVSALRNSLRGLVRACATERAVRQEMLLLAAAVPVAFVLSPSIWVRAALIVSVLFVLAAELLNTAVEKLCDHLHAARHPAIGYVKDLGSAAVLATLGIAGVVWVAAIAEWLVR